MPRSVVCVSRVSEVEGDAIGRLVADRLGFAFVDEEVISRAAELGGIDPQTVAEAERRRLMFGLPDTASAGAVAGAQESSSEAVRAAIRDAIREFADRGSVVIVGHAASHAAGPRPDMLRVLVTASVETRSSRLAATDGLTVEDARRTIRRSDAARADYFKRFYGVEELPTHYDLVLNTDTLSAEQAARLIAEAATDQPTA